MAVDSATARANIGQSAAAQAAPSARAGIPGLKILRGKASVFGGQTMAGGGNATTDDAISINIKHYYAKDGWDRLGEYWLLISPNKRPALHVQGDRGPRQDIDREFDLTRKAAAAHGYGYDNFPTDEGEWIGIPLGTKSSAAAQQRASTITASGGLGALVAGLGDPIPFIDPLGLAPTSPGDALDTVKEAAGMVADVLEWLFGEDARDHWIRIGLVILGWNLLIIGAIGLAAVLLKSATGLSARDIATLGVTKGRAFIAPTPEEEPAPESDDDKEKERD